MKCKRILLKALERRDAEAIYTKYAGNKDHVMYMAWPVHASMEDTKAFLNYLEEAAARGLEYGYGIIKRESGEFMGTIGFKNESGRVFFGYILAPEFHGNGYATEATGMLLDWLKGQEEVYRIWAFCDVNNLASRKVLEKSGLKEEGLIHNWCVAPNQNNRPTDCVFYYLPIT